jgi:two-component system sensor histidine kinase/response regulator
LAHTLKGVSGQIGAQTVQTLAQLLENALQQREASQVLTTLRSQIAEMLGSLIDAIEAALPQESARAAPLTIDQDKLAALYGNLLALLEKTDFASSTLWNANQELLHAGLAAQFAGIDSAVQNFDFETALKELRLAISGTGLTATPG